jgi:hypothetical protein
MMEHRYGGFDMKQYVKPVLVKRELLSTVAAKVIGSEAIL